MREITLDAKDSRYKFTYAGKIDMLLIYKTKETEKSSSFYFSLPLFLLVLIQRYNKIFSIQ